MLLVAMGGSVFLGAASLSFTEVWGAITHGTGLFVSPEFPQPSVLRQSILFDLRIPRILMSVIVGGALAVAGAALQAITRNDLAEPYLLGISSGASTGAVVVIILTSGASIGGGVALGLTGGAAIGALVSFAVLLLLLRGSGFSSTQVVLTGVLVGQFFAAITSLILMARGDADSVRGVMFWLLGALGASRWESLWVVAVVCSIACAVIWSISRYLDCLSFGDDTAESMGVPVCESAWNRFGFCRTFNRSHRIGRRCDWVYRFDRSSCRQDAHWPGSFGAHSGICTAWIFVSCYHRRSCQNGI